MRLMVNLGGMSACIDTHDNQVVEQLHFPRLLSRQLIPGDEKAIDRFFNDAAVALRHMEARANKFRFGRVLEQNLNLLGREFAMSKTERLVLGLAICLMTEAPLRAMAAKSHHDENTAGQIALVLRQPLAEVTKALAAQGCLRKCGFIEVESRDTSLAANLKLSNSSLQMLARRKLASAQELFATTLRRGPASTLCREDFAHLRPGFGFVASMLAEALNSKRCGVNVLLYGPPGTGKTECARLLAQEVSTALHEVSFLAADGDPFGARRRLQSAAMSQRLLRGHRALLLFDEVDAVFNDGSHFFGKPTTAELSKAWVNELLEKNNTPMIWTANRIDRMDPAFVRRFDLVIPMESPPLRQRERLLEKLCGDALDLVQIRRFAQVRSATPAVVTRAVNVIRRVECTDRPRAELLEAVLDGTLTAQGHANVQRSCRGLPAQDYDISLCNADANLDAIAAGLAHSGKGRICLYGPPGTGKTAFGYWLAKMLDRPLVLKRASEIQSMWVGEMEQNLARAFEEAAQDRAVLQIDEVDTFLQDRRNMQRPWEISQINEFLTQLESYDGVFVASTNLMEGLDRAALRRFDYKIRVDYMRPEQSLRMFTRMLHDWNVVCDDDSLAGIARLSRLTPGDFAVVARCHGVMPFASASAVLDALRREVGMRSDEPRRIGFV